VFFFFCNYRKQHSFGLVRWNVSFQDLPHREKVLKWEVRSKWPMSDEFVNNQTNQSIKQTKSSKLLKHGFRTKQSQEMSRNTLYCPLKRKIETFRIPNQNSPPDACRDQLVSLISQVHGNPSSRVLAIHRKNRGQYQHPPLLSRTAPCQIHETRLPVGGKAPHKLS